MAYDFGESVWVEEKAVLVSASGLGDEVAGWVVCCCC
jgi:hypothetical protein